MWHMLKGYRNSPIQIDIQNDDTTPGYQEGLLLNERYILLDGMREANQSLDSKAMGFMQASAIIVGFVSVFAITNISGAGSSLLQQWGIESTTLDILSLASSLASFIAFIVMIFFVIRTLFPLTYELPGSSDWNAAYNDYINASREESFQHILSNLLGAIKTLEHLNHYKSQRLAWAGYLLIFQVVTLMVAVVLI